MGVQAGRRDRQITLQRLVETQEESGSGAVEVTPKKIAKLWAEMVQGDGSEGFGEDQVKGWSPVTWRTLYFQEGADDPTVKWQIVYRGVVYDVTSVREIDRKKGWEFISRARAEDQRS